MSFWSIEIPPKKKVEVVCFLDLRVTKATLGSGSISDSDRTFVKVEHSNIEGEKTTATVAVLHKFEQNSAFDLVFDEGEVLNFYVSGKVPVHLSGYFVDSEEDDEYDEYDDADLEEYMRTREGMEEEEEDEDFEGGEEEEEEEEDEDDEEDDEEFAESEEVSPEFLKKLSEKVKDVQNSKKRKRDSIPSATSPQQPNKKAKQSPAPPKIRKFKSGLIVEQVQSGSGPTKSQNGKIMKMKYVGRLHASRKVFDRSKKPFVFRLGTGEVIKGWDTGLVGMKVGEKRKLIIPPALGYGRGGSPPDIPPNATLEFDVELVGL